jgi:hypothetical protein
MEKEQFVKEHFCAYPTLYISLGGVSGTCEEMEHQIGTIIMDLFADNSNTFEDFAHLLTAMDKEEIDKFSNSPQLKQDWLFGNWNLHL